MKVLKTILLIIAIIVVIVIAIGFFMPKELQVEQTRKIKAPVEMVYAQVNNLRNWEAWSPWHAIDPKMTVEYHNGAIGQGASYTWTSDHKSVGNGKLAITQASPFDSIHTVMDFDGEDGGTANFYFVKEADGVEVTWTMLSDNGNNPFMRLMSGMIKGMIEKSYSKGLASMDSVCQELKKEDWFYVKVKEKPGWKYYGLMADVTMEQMENEMTRMYTTLYNELPKMEIDVTGTPFAVYHSWGENIKMESAIVVDDNSVVVEDILASEIPDQTYAVIKHRGSYDGLENAHMYMDKWLKENKKQLAGPVIERYKVGPGMEENPEKWETYIMYPIK